MKFDIESSEWRALPRMIVDNSLALVRQIGLEIHLSGSEERALLQKYPILYELEQYGFRRWYFHENPRAAYNRNGTRFSFCLELVYVNVKYM